MSFNDAYIYLDNNAKELKKGAFVTEATDDLTYESVFVVTLEGQFSFAVLAKNENDAAEIIQDWCRANDHLDWIGEDESELDNPDEEFGNFDISHIEKIDPSELEAHHGDYLEEALGYPLSLVIETVTELKKDASAYGTAMGSKDDMASFLDDLMSVYETRIDDWAMKAKSASAKNSGSDTMGEPLSYIYMALDSVVGSLQTAEEFLNGNYRSDWSAYQGWIPNWFKTISDACDKVIARCNQYKA